MGHLGIGSPFVTGSPVGIGSTFGWGYSPVNQILQSIQAINYQLQQLQQIEYVQQVQRQQQIQQLQYVVQLLPQQIQQLQQQLLVTGHAPFAQSPFAQSPFAQAGLGFGQPLQTLPFTSPQLFAAQPIFSPQPGHVM
jgi:hypothetical protein